MAYEVTILRAAKDAPALGWTTHWDSDAAMGDWALAPAADPVNPGGLDSTGQIASAVILSLFTDRRAPEGWRPDVADRRGWWGDGVQPDGVPVEPIGSWLWLLKNESVSPAIVAAARTYAEQALAWIVRDRVAARIDVASGIINNPERGVWLDIAVIGRDGQKIYDQKFARLWREV